jgi:hypothetical protein
VPSTLDVLLHDVLNAIQMQAIFGIALADGNQKVGADKQIDLSDRKFSILIVKGVEDNKGISRKVFNLGNLVFVKTILDRKRMETQGIDKVREFLLRCLAVMQPHKASVLCRSQSLVIGCDAREFSCLRDMVEP